MLPDPGLPRAVTAIAAGCGAGDRKESRLACWADSYHGWLFTCEMSLPLSRERGAPVLQVDLYDEAGELKDTGIWVTDPEGKWTRSVA